MSLKEVFVKKVTKVVIPAAGLGTRVLLATKALPKEMPAKIGRASCRERV